MLSDLKNKNENISLINLIVKPDKIIPPTRLRSRELHALFCACSSSTFIACSIFDLDLEGNFSVSM